MRIYLLPFLGLYLLPAAAAEPTLTAKRLGENVYELLLVTDQTADVSVAQQAIWPAAQQLCDGKVPRFGHYKFQSAEPMPGQSSAREEITLQQEVHCDSAGAQPLAGTSLPLAPHDDPRIEKLTNAYLAAKNAGRYAEAYEMFAPSFKASTPLESWVGNARNIRSRAGKVKSIRIKKITWYDNPQSAPIPGTYAAADFESLSDNGRVHCGYVVWLGAADSGFLVMRDEENFIDKESAQALSPERLKAFADQFGCEIR